VVPPDYRVLTQGIEIGAGWTKKGESSHKEYVSHALVTPESCLTNSMPIWGVPLVKALRISMPEQSSEDQTHTICLRNL